MKNALSKAKLKGEISASEIDGGWIGTISLAGQARDMGEAFENFELIFAGKKATHYINERSKIVGPCGQVHAIASSLRTASRKEVIQACREAGIAYGTARTQYQKWHAAQ